MLHEMTASSRRGLAISSLLAVAVLGPAALLAQSPASGSDTAAPTVTILEPMPANGYSYSPIRVSGTAADFGAPPSGVDVVEVCVNSGQWRQAIGTASWYLWIDLVPGKNTIAARAVDKAGNGSLVASVDTMFWGSAAGGGDADADGVSDGQDQCPATPADEEVNSQGCAASQRDTDGDTITDDLDQCPDTPLGDVVDDTGCEPIMDADNDGVDDLHDKCPGTPEGHEVDSRGCCAMQTDTDGDGVRDEADGCPRDSRKVDPGECGCGKPELAGCGWQVTLRITTNRPVPTGIPGAVVYPLGLEVEVWAPDPPNGCRFDHWSGDLEGKLNPVRLVMNSDKIVMAHYTEINRPTIRPLCRSTLTSIACGPRSI